MSDAILLVAPRIRWRRWGARKSSFPLRPSPSVARAQARRVRVSSAFLAFGVEGVASALALLLSVPRYPWRGRGRAEFEFLSALLAVGDKAAACRRCSSSAPIAIRAEGAARGRTCSSSWRPRRPLRVHVARQSSFLLRPSPSPARALHAAVALPAVCDEGRGAGRSLFSLAPSSSEARARSAAEAVLLGASCLRWRGTGRGIDNSSVGGEATEVRREAVLRAHDGVHRRRGSPRGWARLDRCRCGRMGIDRCR